MILSINSKLRITFQISKRFWPPDFLLAAKTGILERSRFGRLFIHLRIGELGLANGGGKALSIRATFVSQDTRQHDCHSWLPRC
jgi:hypothetical protein